MSTPQSSPAQSNEEIKYRLDRLDALIKFEFDLIGYRMTWLVVSQSFLFTAFSVAASNHMNHPILGRMLWLLPSVGICVSAIVYFAILAAHSVVRKLKGIRKPLEETANKQFSCEKASVEADRWEHMLGNVPPYTVPLILTLAWAILLAGIVRGQ